MSELNAYQQFRKDVIRWRIYLALYALSYFPLIILFGYLLDFFVTEAYLGAWVIWIVGYFGLNFLMAGKLKCPRCDKEFLSFADPMSLYFQKKCRKCGYEK